MPALRTVGWLLPRHPPPAPQGHLQHLLQAQLAVVAGCCVPQQARFHPCAPPCCLLQLHPVSSPCLLSVLCLPCHAQDCCCCMADYPHQIPLHRVWAAIPAHRCHCCCSCGQPPAHMHPPQQLRWVAAGGPGQALEPRCRCQQQTAGQGARVVCLPGPHLRPSALHHPPLPLLRLLLTGQDPYWGRPCHWLLPCHLVHHQHAAAGCRSLMPLSPPPLLRLVACRHPCYCAAHHGCCCWWVVQPQRALQLKSHRPHLLLLLLLLVRPAWTDAHASVLPCPHCHCLLPPLRLHAPPHPVPALLRQLQGHQQLLQPERLCPHPPQLAPLQQEQDRVMATALS